jgi:peptidoglycan/LPS O-acetylase OafA/YrhL
LLVLTSLENRSVSSTSATSDRQRERRVTSLDGLRGMAALMVILAHALVAANPQFAAASQSPNGPTVHFPNIQWWLIFTPFHLPWAGPEAVIVFFILSGFVLSLPVVRSGEARLLSYYPRRFLRLYLPAWGAVVVGVLLHAAHARHPGAASNWWLAGHAEGFSTHGTVNNVILVQGSGGSAINPVLWTLQWEVWYSALLPLYLLAGWLTRRRPWLALLLGLAAAIFISQASQDGPDHYLPMFLLGTLMAFHYRALGTLAARVFRRREVRWAAPLVCIGLLTASWWLAGGYAGPRAGTGKAVATVGAAMALALALYLPAFHRLLSSRPAHWFGVRAFSIYLVHEPIIVTIGFLAKGAAPSLWLTLGVAVPLGVIGGDLFYRAVEGPAHNLSRQVGRSIERALAQRRARAAQSVAEPELAASA